MKNRTISVTIEPNSFKSIEVPIAVVGEVSGTVYLKGSEGRNGLGRIIVNFYNSDSVFIARTLTEADGFFSFLGLAPGSYSAQVDKVQLQKLKIIASSPLLFKINSTSNGDVADGLQFVLQPCTY